MSTHSTWSLRVGMLVSLGIVLASASALPASAGTPPSPSASSSTSASVAAGQALVMDRSKGNCLACHTMKGGDVPSNVGPELADMKARFPDRKALYDVLWDEEARNPQTVMPPFGKNLILDRQEINQVVDFLFTL